VPTAACLTYNLQAQMIARSIKILSLAMKIISRAIKSISVVKKEDYLYSFSSQHTFMIFVTHMIFFLLNECGISAGRSECVNGEKMCIIDVYDMYGK